MQRNSDDSKEHHDLITMMVNHFSGQGYRNIKADIPGMPTPDTIRGTKQNHIPDLTAEKNGTEIILEAETATSIFDEHTASQWSLFSSAAANYGGQFHVVAPKEARASAEQRVRNLSIVVHEIWTPKG